MLDQLESPVFVAAAIRWLYSGWIESNESINAKTAEDGDDG